MFDYARLVGRCSSPGPHRPARCGRLLSGLKNRLPSYPSRRSDFHVLAAKCSFAGCICACAAQKVVDLFAGGVARSGRIAAHTAEAESRRSATQRGNALTRWEWQRSDDATGIDARIYDTQIQPQLKRLTNSAIASVIGVSLYYAAEIRRGRRRPHPRHWQRLAKMVGISAHNPKVLQGNVVLPAATP